ncbi:putative sugar nucleotidyl transferase [Fodinibius sp. Rm-B-1B1-1]|uniref:putative sugar nucleotidyl transferase n=1 Tax=Fodinibius alkaliphilus TaxID=3140241 RepID=UPI00315A837E
MQLCFFEDEKLTNLHPLTLTRPIDDLRIGVLTISEKWQKALESSKESRILRSELAGVFESGQITPDQQCIWINSRYLPTDKLIQQIHTLSEGQSLQYEDTVIAAKADGALSKTWLKNGSPDFKTLFVLESNDFSAIHNLWDLFQFNGNEIIRDIELMDPPKKNSTNISKHAVFENQENIYIEEGATIEAGCVLNASKGPIYIGKNATIMSGSHIRGPVAICEDAIVKLGARIYSDTTIGPVCKVGGEVSNTVFHSYSNKAHDGYIGNSVVGQWCNFGAGTTVSNLKTNYSNIKLADWETHEEQDTGQQFVGVIFGDHSKTAINAVINSGTVCGVNCNILSRDFPPKMIHSFSWVGSNVIQPYKLEKALETMEIMMARRDVSMTDGYSKMMEAIEKNSRHPSH